MQKQIETLHALLGHLVVAYAKLNQAKHQLAEESKEARHEFQQIMEQMAAQIKELEQIRRHSDDVKRLQKLQNATLASQRELALLDRDRARARAERAERSASVWEERYGNVDNERFALQQRVDELLRGQNQNESTIQSLAIRVFELEDRLAVEREVSAQLREARYCRNCDGPLT